MSPATINQRSKFYQEMRLRRVLHELDLLNGSCNWGAPSIICNQRELKARVIWRELMSEANTIEVALGL